MSAISTERVDFQRLKLGLSLVPCFSDNTRNRMKQVVNDDVDMNDVWLKRRPVPAAAGKEITLTTKCHGRRGGRQTS